MISVNLASCSLCFEIVVMALRGSHLPVCNDYIKKEVLSSASMTVSMHCKSDSSIFKTTLHCFPASVPVEREWEAAQNSIEKCLMFCTQSSSMTLFSQDSLLAVS